jgi:hypothetical protein
MDREPIEKQNKEPLERAYRKINAAKERLERLLERTSAQRSRICGVLPCPTKPSAEGAYEFVAVAGRDAFEVHSTDTTR